MKEELERRTRYDPAEAEVRIRDRWLESGLYHPEPAGTAAENYSIAIPLRTSPARCIWGTRSTARCRTR